MRKEYNFSKGVRGKYVKIFRKGPVTMPGLKTWQRLFKKTSTGAIQFWEIHVRGNEIITYYGKQGGKEMTSNDIIKVGKNQGRANATSPEEQANAEAQSQWETKVKKGYVQEMGRAEGGETNHDGGWFPMLAHKFSEQGHKIKYPAFVQPKLDGHRCVVDTDGSMWTRTRKPVGAVPHIQEQVMRGFECDKSGYPKLDGELYNHKYKKDFEKITHLVRQEEAVEGSEIVQYHIYDMYEDTMTFKERYEWLKENFPKNSKSLVLVETIEVKDEDELMEAFDHYTSLGYEGAMVRNAEAQYIGKRSYDLQKIKEFDDAEFEIVGVEEGRGRLMGHAGKFICVTKDGTKFGAKMQGELSKLKEYFEKPKLWQGKHLTVKYQGLTGANKVPRFPVGMRFRED